MSEKLSEVTLKHVSTIYSTNSNGQVVKRIGWESEGELEVYGEGGGTLTVIENMNEANADSGACSWVGEAFLPDGTRGLGISEGTWAKVGSHKWNIVFEGEDSIVGKMRFEGEIELATRTFTCTVYSRD
jgi:hypothetical protein